MASRQPPYAPSPPLPTRMSRQVPSRVPLEEGHGPSFLERLVAWNGGVPPRTYREVIQVCEQMEAARQGLVPADIPTGREGAQQRRRTVRPSIRRVYARIFRTTPNLETRFPLATPWHDPSLRGVPFPCQDEEEEASSVLDEFDREASEVLEGYADLVESDADTTASVFDDSNWVDTRRGGAVEEEWDQRAEADRRIWALREAETGESAAREREERIRARVIRRRAEMRRGTKEAILRGRWDGKGV